MFQNYRVQRCSTGIRGARVFVMLLAAALTLILTTGFAGTRTTYVIMDGDTMTTVEGYAGQLEGAVRRAGLELSPTDRIDAVFDGSLVEAQITRSRTVSIRDGNSFTTVAAYNESVRELLDRLNLTPGEYDKLSGGAKMLDSTVTAGQSIAIDRAQVQVQTQLEPIPFEVVRQARSDLYIGEERTVQAGAEGARTLTYRDITVDGDTNRQLMNSTIVSDPVDQIVAYGTKVKPVKRSSLSVSTNAITAVAQNSAGGGVITTSSGQSMSYSRMLNVTATAYTTERQSWKRTATGTIARVGAIAVDPKVIPYGTRMYIQSSDGSIIYGVATAEDCGSGVKGNRVDLFFDTYDTCIQFGVRDCIVYILD